MYVQCETRGIGAVPNTRALRSPAAVVLLRHPREARERHADPSQAQFALDLDEQSIVLEIDEEGTSGGMLP